MKVLNTKAIFAVMNTAYLSTSEIRPVKKTQACMGFEPMTCAIPVLCSTNWVDSQLVAGPYVVWKSSCKDLFGLRSTSKKFNHLQYQVQKMFIFLKTSHTNVANYRCELISIVTVDPTVFQYLSYLLHMSRDHNKIAIGETQHYVAITKPVKKEKWRWNWCWPRWW